MSMAGLLQRTALPAGHVTLLERHNGLVHAAVYALPEDEPETLTLAPLAPPALLELKQAVAAPDPAGSVFGAEGTGPLLEGLGKPSESLAPAAQAEEEAYSLALGKQGPWRSDMVRLVYSSLVTPTSTYDVDVRTGGPSCGCVHPQNVYWVAALHRRSLCGHRLKVDVRDLHACWCHLRALAQSTEAVDRQPATAQHRPASLP